MRGATPGQRRAEFHAAMGRIVEDPSALFDRLLAGPRPSHAELIQLAAGPAPPSH